MSAQTRLFRIDLSKKCGLKASAASRMPMPGLDSFIIDFNRRFCQTSKNIPKTCIDRCLKALKIWMISLLGRNHEKLSKNTDFPLR
uniref:Sea24 n=1 Tax=Klebsiella pneumoniae TaxID=573 RepID=A0A8B0ST77_KLEPN|nr:Sea24 [Klebsiella pneumoniae]